MLLFWRSPVRSFGGNTSSGAAWELESLGGQVMQTMHQKTGKRGALVRDGQLCEEVEAASQDSHDQLSSVYEEITPGSRKHEKQKLSSGKHQHRSEKGKPPEGNQSHDNPGFMDDYGSIAVTDASLSQKAKDSNHDHHGSQHEHKLGRHPSGSSVVVSELETNNVPSLSVAAPNQAPYLNTIFESKDNDTSSYLVQSFPGDPQSDTPPQVCVDNVNVVPVNNKPRTGFGSWFSRPHSRSISSASPMFSRKEVTELTPEPDPQAFQRSFSMRVPSARDNIKPKSRALLRELSFSDADARTVRNYGSLRGGLLVLRRKPVEQEDAQEEGEDMHVDMGPELKSQVKDLMHELLGRGKVRQAALFAQENCTMLVSVPTWDLPHRDEVGLVKTVTSTADTISKLSVGDDSYTFFKHGRDKVMGRSGDRVMVAHKTKFCVVVGVADDNTPGSCMYEVSELVHTMVTKGW